MADMASDLVETVEKKRAGWIKWVLLFLIAGGLGAAFYFLPVKDWLKDGLEAIKGLGFWGPVILVGAYILACIFFIPGSLLTLGAGAIFGVVVGSIAVSVGSTLGAAAAFLVGRTLAKEAVEKRIKGNKKFDAVSEAVGYQGFKIVLLTRLSPVFPFSLLNYAYGVTRVSFWKYFLASWIGMMPGTVMYVYLGYLGRDTFFANTETKTALDPDTEMWMSILKYVGFAVTVIVTVFVTKVARKALKEAVPENENTEAKSEDEILEKST